MSLLAVGLLLFFLAHLIPMVPVWRNRLVGVMGLAPYKVVFALVSLAGLVLIVYGFSQAPRVPGYQVPAWGMWLPLIAMPLAFILLIATYVPCNIKRWTRHPMTIAILLWAGAHLLASPWAASGLLFGSFAIYAVLNLLGQVTRPQPPRPEPRPMKTDAIVVAMGLAATVVFALTHHILFGVSALPMIFGSSTDLIG
ncbi:NnrU family protein [Roseospira goensis]|uniref:Putative membrane protein n=1 Tax=Roseospira goensis TaxID=391922 RepID=A0A7W6RYW2_9PROT|nr:NnrU family protein [Roseospira goensis]MBB4285773.1 putative membrane protein [Roseospira goensis]